MEMKEMIYTNYRQCKILMHYFYKGYEFYILSLGAHPTAYVRVEKNHPLYTTLNYYQTNISCHGGITYTGYLEHITHNTDSWYMGWDYAHYGDYMGYYDEDSKGKKWTTVEIFEEVKDVIEQLIKEEQGSKKEEEN